MLCQNMYNTGEIKISIGRYATAKPRYNRYYTGNIVKFSCPQYYQFANPYWRMKTNVWLKCTEYGWLQSWPTCRGIY